MSENNSNSSQTKKYLTPIDVWALAFGSMVGWGAFVMPGTTFLPVAGPLGTAIALSIGLIVILIVGYTVFYLMRRSTSSGGVYSFTKEAFGRDHAFLCSWFLCLSYLTIVFLNGTALYLVVRTISGERVHSGIYYMVGNNAVYLKEVALSILALAGVALLFVLAGKILHKLQTLLAVILIAGIVIITVACLPGIIANKDVLSFGTTGLNPGFAIFSLVILAPWAFVGFEIITLDEDKFKFPVKRSGAVIAISLILAAFAYIVMTFVSVASIPDGYTSWHEYIADLNSLDGVISVPTFYAAESIMGHTGLVITAITAFASIFTGIIGAYRAIMRVLSTMADDKILSDKFSKASFGILFVMGLAIAISLVGRNTLEWFVDLTSFGAIVAYGYTSAAAYKIAKTEGNKKVMAAGALGTIISVIFGIAQLVPNLAAIDTMESASFLLLSLWCLLGFVFYWRTVKRSTLTEYNGMSTSGTVLFTLLVYAAIMWIWKRLMMEETIESLHRSLIFCGLIFMLIIFTGLIVMLYIQNLVRRKHEVSEREKIRAVEGSLAKSQFLFNMSHDIRTPMNAIMGYTHLALKDPTSDKQKDYLTKIDTSSKHLLALINDILEMSRIENGKIELEYTPTDLRTVFEDMKSIFSEQMKKKDIVFAVFTTQVKNYYVWCDRKNVNRVLLNVLSNAYKFTLEGGNVSASLYEISGSEEGYSSYEIRVQDSGIGMSKEFVDKMFNAFERERTSTDSGLEGTGLGLAITKNIVDIMGGTIEVITAPGMGTEMIIRIKFKLASQEDIRKDEENRKVIPEKTMDLTGKRVLLVEDNAINMEIARMILEQLGLDVESAENGKVAVEMVRDSEPGHYDAVLMDIQMPVMDGYSATRAIRALDNKELADIPVLAMTANAFKEDIDASREAGMQAHIAKPVDTDVLVSELTRVLSKEKKGEDQ